MGANSSELYRVKLYRGTYLRVNDLMPAKGAGLPETFATHFANEGSGSCVHRHVTG